MRSLYFVFNPVAGNGLSVKAFDELRALLDERGVAYAFGVSEYAGHACELAKAARDGPYDCIVAVGGDGTAREVAMQLFDCDMPFSLLPCGTGNDLARALGLPREPAAVLDVLLTHGARPMDAGTVNGVAFINVAGFGFDVDVLTQTERYKKRFRGGTAYLLGLISAVWGLRLRSVRIETDEGEIIKRRALIVAAGNGTHIGGGMNITPRANPHDGLFDVCIMSDVRRLTVLQVLSRFIKGRHLGLPITTYFTTTGFTAYSDPPSPLNCDGEVTGTTPAVFKLMPNALRVIA